MATATARANFEPADTQVRLLRQGINRHPYWIVSLSTLSADGQSYAHLAVARIDATSGEIAEFREQEDTKRRRRRGAVTMRVLVLQHIACEHPGVFSEVMHERGAESVAVEVDEGEPLPDWREFDAVLAMGGPMGAGRRRRPSLAGAGA